MSRVLVLLLIGPVALAGCATVGLNPDRAVIRAKNKVAPALVHVRPVKEVFRRGERREVSVIGSGFIITADGYVVTNEHVAGRSNYVHCVLFDKDEVEAKVVGVDPFTDIAVLKLETDRTDLPFVRLGSSSNLEAGQTVLALGSPHGLSRSVSLGIVSVPERNLENLGASGAPFNNWIQTDAAINPGNSGGPLVNLRGEVVGINTRKLSGADNLGFAIPIDVAKEIFDDIVAEGEVKRSTIGIAFQEMTRVTDDPSQHGVIIGDVDPLSPAYEAQLRPGDILLNVNGVNTNARFVEDLPAIRKQIADIPVGEQVTLTIMGDEGVRNITLKTEELIQRDAEEQEFVEWGCSIRDLTPSVIRRAQLLNKKGVVVTGVQVGSAAADAELRRGDIILKVDDEEIENLDHFVRVYEDRVSRGQPLVMLTLKRVSLTLFALIKQEGIADEPDRENASD